MSPEQTKLQDVIAKAMESRDECIRQLANLTSSTSKKIAELIVSGGDWESEVSNRSRQEKTMKQQIEAYELELPVLQQWLEEAKQ